MKLTRYLGASVVALGIAFSVSAPTSVQAKPQELTVYGGPLNTSWYVIAGWLATKLSEQGIKANSELGGALTNVMQISGTPKKMGFTFAVSAGLAAQGVKPFPSKMTNICALQIFQRSAFHVLVSEASGVAKTSDLKGKKFSGQAVGNLSQLALSHYLSANGMNEKDMELAIGGQQFGADGVKDRRFAGFAAMSSYPSPPMMDAATSVPVRFLPIDEATFAKVKALNGGYTRTEIPAGTYPNQKDAVPTFGTVAFMIMNDATTEADQYFVTKLIHENWDGMKAVNAATKFLTPKLAVGVPGTPLCPGATKYWKEIGAL
jgi:TRAP transporter TAXI family solute receptor